MICGYRGDGSSDKTLLLLRSKLLHKRFSICASFFPQSRLADEVPALVSLLDTDVARFPMKEGDPHQKDPHRSARLDLQQHSGFPQQEKHSDHLQENLQLP